MKLIKLRFTVAPPNKTTNVCFYDFIKICYFKDNICLLFRHHRNEVDLYENVSVIYMCAAVKNISLINSRILLGSTISLSIATEHVECLL